MINSEHNNRLEYQFIDSRELAERWAVPETWIRERVRSHSEDPLPHVRLGKYVRFRSGSPELEGWAGHPELESCEFAGPISGKTKVIRDER